MQPRKKLVIPTVTVEEEEKKPAPTKKPVAAAKQEGEGNQDDFKKRLEAMLLGGPKPQAVSRPAVRQSTMPTAAEIMDMKLDVPKIVRARGITTKYDISKYNFDGF